MSLWTRLWRRTPPPPADNRLSLFDATVAAFCGLTEADWRGASDSERAEYRDRYCRRHL